MIIGTILVASVGLGFANEYKAEKAAEALHSSIHHAAWCCGTGIRARRT